MQGGSSLTIWEISKTIRSLASDTRKVVRQELENRITKTGMTHFS